MKKQLKFLITTAVITLFSQGAFAVTLPPTSYNPYQMSNDESISIYSSGSMVTGSYQLLGEGDYSQCEGDGNGYTKNGELCTLCCKELVPDVSTVEGREKREACISYCTQGPPLPLDGGLGIMLILSVIGAAVRSLMCRKLS